MAEHCFFCGEVTGVTGCERCGTVRRARDEKRVRAPCPRCGDAARLVPFGLGDASLQACPRCKGMFVGAVDWDTLLEAFAQDPLPDVLVPDADATSSHGPYRSAPSSAPVQPDLSAAVRCPTCGGETERLEFAVISRVIIDVCPEHGVWLDAGELERIVGRDHPHPLGEPVPLVVPNAYPPPPVVDEVDDRQPVTRRRPTFVRPVEAWDRPTPPTALPRPPRPRERENETWTVQLGRALGRLIHAIAFRKG